MIDKRSTGGLVPEDNVRGMQQNISLHIERLVLDGVDVGPGQRHLLQAAVKSELTRLLSEGGLASQLTSGVATPRIVGAAIQLSGGNGPTELGRQIAGAVYGGIGQ